MNIFKGCAAHANSRRHITQSALHQYHICCINGDVCSCSNGNAHICTGQCRRVIDSIAHHGNLAFFFQSTDHAFLAIRKNPCNHFIHARLFANGFCGAFVVTGQHDNFNAHVLKFLHCLRTVFFNNIRNCDDA